MAKNGSRPRAAGTRAANEGYEEVLGALAELPDEFIQCRTDRHAWVRVGAFLAPDGIMVLRNCVRCPATHSDLFDRDMRTRLRKRRYELPDGYRLPGRVDAGDLAHEALSRMKVYDSEEALIASARRRRGKNVPVMPVRARGGRSAPGL